MATNGEIVKRKLLDLRVVDLKAELENRNLDKAGIKAVLQERLQQALEKEGRNFEEYLFEVTESPIAKKPTKRTNKKLTRDDESETHSNVDESQNDLNLEDDDKFDSDEDRIDEKVLETTEDTINLSIEEEEEKLLIEEDISSEGEKQANDFKRNGKSSGDPQTDSLTPKRDMTKSQALSTSSSHNTSEQEASVGSGERSEVGANVKDAATKSDRDQGKAAVGGGSNHNNSDASGTRVDDSGKGEAGGNVVSSSATKTPSNSNGNESKENAPAEGNSSVGSSAAVVRQEDTSSGATTVATSPNKAKSAAVKEGTKLTADRAKLVRPMVSGKNLWVTGLSSATRATDLKSLFSKHGKVLGAKVVSNARSSVSRCYGFITMATAEEASKCIQHLHRTELHGRMISVERAKADPLGPGRKVAVRQATIITKKAPLKKDAPSSVARTDGQEKKLEEDTSEKKEKAKAKDDEIVKESTEPPNKASVEEDIQAKEIVVSGDNQNEEKNSKKSDDRRDSIRRSTRDSRERRGSERSYEHHRENFLTHRRPYFRDNKFVRRPFTRRPVGYRSMMRRTTLTFDRIRAERLRQRAREEERELRDSERKRRLDIARQREIERRQREEAVRLERERERLRIEREKLERERAEVLRLEREKQKLERERIEREREELRRRERMSFNSRVDEHRRPVKRSYNSFHSGRDVEYEERKRTNISGGPRRIENFERRSDHRTESSIRGGGGGGIGRRDSHVPERGNDSRTERFERGPISRDTDLRGHGREDRSVSYRDSSDIGPSRTVKDDWKGSSDRVSRGHRDSGKGMGSSSYGNDGGRSGGESRYGDRGNDTWHSTSQSESRSGGGSKPYNASGSGGGSGGWGGTDRKSDSQWGSRNDNWGGGGGGSGCSGGIGSGRSQQLGINQSMMSQGQSSMFESGSGTGGGGSSGMIGMGISGGGSSYSSDRFDSYKGMNSMRRY